MAHPVTQEDDLLLHETAEHFTKSGCVHQQIFQMRQAALRWDCTQHVLEDGSSITQAEGHEP